MPLYTRRGDKGETDILGARIPKSHPRIEAYGMVDELNAVLGMVRESLEETDLRQAIRRIQDDLFVLSAELATAPSRPPILRLSPSRVKALERSIDRLQKEAPSPRHFIVPGGTFEASLVHFARTVCRRTERVVVALAQKETIRPTLIRYLNRLSDFLFALALVVNKRVGARETLWEGRGHKAS